MSAAMEGGAGGPHHTVPLPGYKNASETQRDGFKSLTPFEPPFILSLCVCFFKYVFNLFIHLTVSGLACGMWNLVPRPGIQAGPPA